MAKAFVFPGQGSQFPGMCKDLYDAHQEARELCQAADRLLGFSLTDVMFNGTAEDLKQTKVTQPAVFLHSVVAQRLMTIERPDMVAGHSLGEFSALVASGALGYEDALRLVAARANAMNEACRQNPGKMAAIINLDDATVRKLCDETEGIVVPANFNSPGQVVISGEADAIDRACKAAKAAGAKRALPLPVGGAFHSPLMEPARAALAKAIDLTQFGAPICPIFQNVDSLPHTDPAEIKANLIAQLTGPVLWSQSVLNMHQAGATDFTELGPGSVLTNLIGRIIG